MSELFEYNTKDLIQPKQQENPIFDLVHENSPILREVLPEFNFVNPPLPQLETENFDGVNLESKSNASGLSNGR